MPKIIEVVIDSVRVSLTNHQRIVILKEVDQERYLPIWVGLYEAEAITIALQNIQVARPQTHDLLKILILTLNAKLIQVEISSLSDDVFYGNLVIEIQGQRRNVDCRPSDALALAVRMSVPVFVSQDVMDNAGIIPEEDIADVDVPESDREEHSDFEIGNLDVFEDFLKNYKVDSSDSDSDANPDTGSDSEPDEDL